MKKIHYVLGACAIMAFVVIGIFLLLNKPDNTIGAVILPRTFTDLIGTRVASSTTGIGFYGAFTASSTYPFVLLGASEATIFFDVTAASSSASRVNFSVYGSVDPECSTATTTTIYNRMTKAQIRWFDALPFIDNAAVISSFSNATSSIDWSNPSLVQRAIHFSDLSFECLMVEANASSTILYAGYKTKD